MGRSGVAQDGADFRTENDDVAEMVAGQEANCASTYQEIVPAGSRVVNLLTFVVASRLGSSSPAAAHTLYAVARGTGDQARCTGDVSSAAPSEGAISTGGRLAQLLAVVAKVACADSWGGHPAKKAMTHHSNEPSGRRRVRLVSMVVPTRVGEPPL